MKIYPLVLGPVQTNCYIVSSHGKAIIIDPADSPEKIIQYLNTHKLEVEAIFLTHGHFDHIGAVNDLGSIFNVPIYAHRKEKSYFENPEYNMSTMMYQNLVLNSSLNYCYVADNEELQYLGTSIKALHVPGHTPGSLCYNFEDAKVVFTGDTLFAHSIGRTDFVHGNHDQLVQ